MALQQGQIFSKGGITEISTTDEMNSLLQDETNIGKMYRYVGVTNSTYTKGDIYEVAVLWCTWALILQKIGQIQIMYTQKFIFLLHLIKVGQDLKVGD